VTDSNLIKTGVIGLGTMGQGMAANLQRSGALAGAWNRTRSRAEAFADEHNCTLFDDPTSLAAGCELIITSVSADNDLLQVVDQLLSGLALGKVVLDTSTVNSETAREAARRVTDRGALFLDAPVSGGSEGAINGTLAMMVGGDAATLDRLRPTLTAITNSVTHMGPVGSGQATKAVNQIMVAGINQAVTEALAFGQQQGLDMHKVIEVVGGGAAGNWFLDHRGKTMVNNSFTPGFKLALHNKDLEIIRQMAAQLGVELPIVEMTLADYRSLLDEGHGEEDISTLFHRKRDLFSDG